VSLLADVKVTVANFSEEVALEVADGEVVAVLGPNGSGKSTLLRALAGIQPLSGGRIELDGVVLDDPGAGYLVPPERRPCGVVFQDYLLFPHLSAQGNVAFGLRNRGATKADAAARALEWLDRMGVAGQASLKPARLSGGQAQRVAMARALAVDPRLLLLDEPMAALDVSQRGSVRHELRQHLRQFGGSCVLVTHDLLDAAAIADRLVIVEDGVVVQAGTLAAITARPRTRYVAELAGLNLLRGNATGDALVLHRGAVLQTASAVSGDALAVIAPRDIALYLEQPEGSRRNTWFTRVDEIHSLGDRARILLATPIPVAAEITTVSLSNLGLTEGSSVWASVKATQIDVYPDDPREQQYEVSQDASQFESSGGTESLDSDAVGGYPSVLENGRDTVGESGRSTDVDPGSREQ
jgi:molybdate transport system ATP-binding protein